MINKNIELKKYPILAMNQIEKYIDDFYDSIEGFKLSTLNLDNLFLKITINIPNNKKTIYSFYSNQLDLKKTDMILLHKMVWNKSNDIRLIKENSTLKKEVRKYGCGASIPTISDSFYMINKDDIEHVQNSISIMLNYLLNDISYISVDENQSFVEIYSVTDDGYRAGGMWVSDSLLKKICKEIYLNKIKIKKIDLDKIIWIKSI
ncbi:hypothetical protein HMPREF3032_00979 [Veillonella sp. DNF00869]|nr:hypothetical protein HMPREF3032_00979 [Veillonella sp. DNF00869]